MCNTKKKGETKTKRANKIKYKQTNKHNTTMRKYYLKLLVLLGLLLLHAQSTLSSSLSSSSRIQVLVTNAITAPSRPQTYASSTRVVNDTLLGLNYDINDLLDYYNSTASANASNASRRAPNSDQTNNVVKYLFVSFIYIPIIICTIVGNMLVVLAVVIVRKLHTQDNANNFLIVSLAISDFLVGVLAMPLAVYVELSDENK